MGNGDAEDAATPYVVAFATPATTPVSFDMGVWNSAGDTWALDLSLPVEKKLSITGMVKNTAGVAVPNALIECWGTVGATSRTDATGGYRLDGLPTNGVFKIRTIPGSYAKSTVSTSTLAGSDGVANFVVAQPDVSFTNSATDVRFSNNVVSVAVQWPLSDTAEVIITNAVTFDHIEMPYSKIALISDDEQLTNLVHLIESMGFGVDSYTGNYEVTEVVWAEPLTKITHWDHIPVVHYSSDDALIFKHDLIIADISGLDGHGRLLLENEQDVYERYHRRQSIVGS